jgi:hypothetical protein
VELIVVIYCAYLIGTGGFAPRLKQPGHEIDHSSPSSVEIKKDGALHPLPHTSSWRGS